VSPGVFAGIGITAALAVAGAVTGALSLVRHDEYQELNNGTDPAGAEDLRKEGVALSISTDVLLGAALVAAVATTIGYFVSAPASNSATGKRQTRSRAPRGVLFRF
jgi:hypothetical protein